MVIMHCRNCKRQLHNFGGIAEVIYYHICEHFAIHGIPFIITQEEINGIPCHKPITEYLEKKGFLVSTDISEDRISIKPVGFIRIEENVYFCCRNHMR